MDSTRLTDTQADQLRQQIARHLRYFGKLQQRLQRLGFPPTDQLMREAMRARDAVQDLHVAAHYAGCGHGVGRAKNAISGGVEPIPSSP